MDAMVSIGTDKEGVEAVGQVIINILGCGQDQSTIVAALGTLSKSVSVSGLTLSNCAFINKESYEED